MFNKQIQKMHEHNHTLKGRHGFTLLMKEDGKLNLYTRENQPCYGELRKYHSTHGDECTQPHDSRPNDLHHPFPNGEPVAVGIRFGGQNGNKFLESVYSESSPWLKGFVSPEFVEFTKEPSGRIIGAVFTNTDFDPTVFVNLLNTIKSNHINDQLYDSILKSGFNEREIIILLMTFHVETLTQGYLMRSGNVGYYYPLVTDIRRVLEADPLDLSGGTFRNRYDYNRKNLHNIFSVSENLVDQTTLNKAQPLSGVENPLYSEVVKRFKEEKKNSPPKNNMEIFVPIFKEVMNRVLNEQKA